MMHEVRVTIRWETDVGYLYAAESATADMILTKILDHAEINRRTGFRNFLDPAMHSSGSYMELEEQ
jgi:hypothetical protein